MKPPAKPPLPKAARLRLQRWLARLVLLAVLAFSVWLLWWSLFVRLAPVNRQYQDKTQELSALADRVDQARVEWTAPKLEQLAAQFQDAQTLLFADAEEMADWGRQVKLQAAALGLDAAVQWGAPQPCPAGQKLLVTQAGLNLQPFRTAGVTNPPYLRLLNFTRSLTNTKRRVDLLALTVTGNSNSVQEAGVVVQLWSQERSPQ